MKKLLAITLSALVLLSLAAFPAAAEGVVEIEFWHSIEEQYRAPYEALITQFNEENPDIKVIPLYQGSYATSNESFLSANAAGGDDLPSVIQLIGTSILPYSMNGVLAPLDQYIADSGFAIDDYAAGMVRQYSNDGKIYGIPGFCSVCPTVFYNKGFATEEGVTVPENWADWDAFVRQVAKPELAEDGSAERYAVIFGGWGAPYFGSIFWSNGVTPFNEDGTQCTLDSPEAMEIYRQLKTWCDEGLTKWAYGTNASTNMRQAFIDGRTFAVFHTSSLYTMYNSNIDDLGIAFAPGGTTGREAELGGSGFAVPAKISDEKKAAAWRLIEFLSSPEPNMTLVEITGGYLPTSSMALATDAAAAFLEKNPQLENLYAMLDSVNPAPAHPAWDDVRAKWQDAISMICNEGADVDSTIAQLIKDANALIDDLN